MSMNDGLDGRETVAFGLAAGEMVTLVLGLLTAYASLRSGLPGALAWAVAAVVAACGAILAWGRLAGRPLLEWALLVARFALRTRHRHGARLRAWLGGAPGAGLAGPGGTVIQLALRPRVTSAPQGPSPPAEVVGGPVHGTAVAPGSRVVAFFSLSGGTGRTMLAVEVAVLLAARGRADAAVGGHGRRVALVDATARNPTAAMRLGIPLTAAPLGGAGSPPIVHRTGLLVFAGSHAARSGGSKPVARTIDAARRAGAQLIVLDIDCDLGDRCVEALRQCDEVHIVVTPTSGGVLDAYRSTAWLRRLGLREGIRYVVNRWRPGDTLAETMEDLGGRVGSQIPEDDALRDVEARHRPAALNGPPAVVTALEELATAIASAAAAGWAGSDAASGGASRARVR